MGCYHSVTVNASVDQVWDTLRKFHDFSWCSDVITQLEVVGDSGGTETGAKRILNGVFHETLLALDDEERTFSYSIDDGPEALFKENVQGYIGEVRVFPVTDNDSTTAGIPAVVESRRLVIPFYGLYWGLSKVTSPDRHFAPGSSRAA